MTAPLPTSSDPALWQAVGALYHPGAVADPYPAYEALRAGSQDGLVLLPEWNAWLATGHAAVSAVLRSPAALSGNGVDEDSSAQSGTPPATDAARLLRHMMLWQNGPSHQRLRGLVSAAFTPRVVEEQRELVRSLLDELLPPALAGEDLDLVARLAHPLPARVILAMLGLSGDDETRFVRWSNLVAELLGGPQATPDLLDQIDRDAREMRLFFRDLAETLRVCPQPGLLSAMAGAQGEGGPLSGDELLSNAVLLLTAGHETTSNLIPGGLLELSRQPAAWAALTRDPRRAGVADELLRVVSPVQLDGRTLGADLGVNGQRLKAGQQVQLLLGAANRDPAVFPNPNQIDWERPNSARHLAFAAGPHYCLGASLARLEIAEVFAALAGRFPRLRVLDPSPPFKPNLVLRGPRELRLRLEG